jgi:hypothetical protein
MACGTESHRVAAMNNKGKWASTIIQRIYTIMVSPFGAP